MRYLILVFLILIPHQADALTPEEIVDRSQAAFLYQGSDFKTRILMKLITESGKERIREMTMLRKNYGKTGGEQKYFIYFHKPSDVKKMTFMIYKYKGRDDDRWLFIPSINMTKRIAARDKTSSFVGSDFTYEDISGRDIDDDTHSLEREEVLNGQDVYVIKSTPKTGDVNYSYKMSWISRKHFLPLKEEYYDLKGGLMRIFTAVKIEEYKGFPTVVQRTMKNLQSGHRTEVDFLDIHYDIGIEDSLFSERFLKRPPAKWIK